MQSPPSTQPGPRLTVSLTDLQLVEVKTPNSGANGSNDREGPVGKGLITVSSPGPQDSLIQPCPSVHLFPLYLSNRLTFDLDLLHMCGSLPWLTGIETEGHRSRSRLGLIMVMVRVTVIVRVKTRSISLRSSIEDSFLVKQALITFSSCFGRCSYTYTVS